MKAYQEKLARLVAESGALFFKEGLRLKDGRPTPYFFNLGVFRTGRLSRELGHCFAQWMHENSLENEVDVIIGPSYKGSAIAQATAIALYEEFGEDLAFDYDRKEAKTHGEATGHGYLFVTGAALEGGRFMIIDDVGTSMATKLDLVKKIQWLAPRAPKPLDIKGVCLAVDREQTQAVYDDQGRVKEGRKGPDAFSAFSEETGVPVNSLIGIRECIKYLYAESIPVNIDGVMRPLDDLALSTVNEYLEVYGRDRA